MEILHVEERVELLTYAELPPLARREFPYVEKYGDDQNTPQFFEYRGNWHDAHDFWSVEAASPAPEFNDFDGYINDSFYSGIVIKYLSDETFDEGFLRVGTWIV